MFLGVVTQIGSLRFDGSNLMVDLEFQPGDQRVKVKDAFPVGSNGFTPPFDPADLYGPGVVTVFDVIAYWLINFGGAGLSPTTGDTFLIISPVGYRLVTVP